MLLDKEGVVCIYCVKPKGRQDQQGNMTIWLPVDPKALDGIDRAHPELGKGVPKPSPVGQRRQKAHMDKHVLLDKVSSAHSTSVASVHPLAPSQWPLRSLSHGTLDLSLPFLVLALPKPSHTSPRCQPWTPAWLAEQDSEGSLLCVDPGELGNIWLGPPASRNSSWGIG